MLFQFMQIIAKVQAQATAHIHEQHLKRRAHLRQNGCTLQGDVFILGQGYLTIQNEVERRGFPPAPIMVWITICQRVV